RPATAARLAPGVEGPVRLRGPRLRPRPSRGRFPVDRPARRRGGLLAAPRGQPVAARPGRLSPPGGHRRATPGGGRQRRPGGRPGVPVPRFRDGRPGQRAGGSGTDRRARGEVMGRTLVSRAVLVAGAAVLVLSGLLHGAWTSRWSTSPDVAEFAARLD